MYTFHNLAIESVGLGFVLDSRTETFTPRLTDWIVFEITRLGPRTTYSHRSMLNLVWKSKPAVCCFILNFTSISAPCHACEARNLKFERSWNIENWKGFHAHPVHGSGPNLTCESSCIALCLRHKFRLHRFIASSVRDENPQMWTYFQLQQLAVMATP